MPVIREYAAVSPAVVNDRNAPWRPLLRIDTVGGNVQDVSDAIMALQPQGLVYAEGDSWFDKFTPLPKPGTNLLDAIRSPFVTAVVDVAHIGDEVKDMVRGHQARQTEAMFRLFSFDAILLSAGGNDLKNVFADMFAAKAQAADGRFSAFGDADLARLADPASFSEFFEEVAANIRRFVALRDAAKDARTRAAPIFLHGYDYFQPRPAGAAIFAGSRIGSGPWLYPSLKAAGLDDAQMRSTADAVIDAMNQRLAADIAPLENVNVIDQRGLLSPAAPGSQGDDQDWLDEIHPNAGGFAKLARNRWDVLLAQAQHWQPRDGDLVAPLAPSNASTALGAGGPVTA